MNKEYRSLDELMAESGYKVACTCDRDRGKPGLHHLECCPYYYYQAGARKQISAEALRELLKEHDESSN